MTSKWVKFVLEPFPHLIKKFYTYMEPEGSKCTERKIVRF